MNRQGLIEGIAESAAHDRRLIVERALDAREIEVAVIGNDDPMSSVCGEIRYHGQFYDYKSKYDVNGADLVIPAELTSEISERIRELAVDVFRT